CSVSHGETKQNPLPGEDHSQSKRLRSNTWAECRDKKGPASSRRRNICLDISFYRTLCLEKTTLRVRDYVQTLGLNAETKKDRHRAVGEIFVLTFPFIGHFR